MDWRGALERALDDKVLFDTPMAKRVAFRIGGTADALVRPHTSKELADCLGIARKFDLPVTILGTGSNVLVSDRGIRGITVRLSGELCDVEILDQDNEFGRLSVGAGALNPPVVTKALEHQFVGIEFLATIPGTFGGALIMNAGAHGGEIGPYVQSVELVGQDLEVLTRKGPACGFEYRQSGFSRSEVITKACLRIPLGDAAEAKLHLQEMRAHRKKTQPIKEPNAGSIFKNPPGDYAGRLIEACGFKGKRVGGALISPKHANFIVNENEATATDVVALAKLIQQEVLSRFEISLEWEVKRIGDWS